MHLAKGLEFKAVVVMACDLEVPPLQERIETVSDEVELEDVYDTERHLSYLACTRARDRLLVSGVAPGSEFPKDLRWSAARLVEDATLFKRHSALVKKRLDSVAPVKNLSPHLAVDRAGPGPSPPRQAGRGEARKDRFHLSGAEILRFHEDIPRCLLR